MLQPSLDTITKGDCMRGWESIHISQLQIRTCFVCESSDRRSKQSSPLREVYVVKAGSKDIFTRVRHAAVCLQMVRYCYCMANDIVNISHRRIPSIFSVLIYNVS